MPSPLRVIVIDDSPADLELTRVVFEALDAPVEVRTYERSDVALQALRTPGAARPDVILLDLNMPGMTGHELLHTLKADPALRDIPVVVLSTSTYPGDIEHAYEGHASGYLLKQLSLAEFEKQLSTFVADWTAQRDA